MILDANGQKMSKSRGNVVDPWDAVNAHGADGIRWYMITVSNPWLPKQFDPEAVRESSAQFFDTVLNTYRFFALYANVEGWEPSQSDPEWSERPTLDRWILSRLHGLVARVREELDQYEPTRAYRLVGEFVDADLSNWYVRRSRGRFWGNTDPVDQSAAFRTLFDTLRVVSSLVAPVTPFFSDWLHRALTGSSSHLAPFPAADSSVADEALEEQMSHVRALSTLGRAAREEVKIRVRQPLGTMRARRTRLSHGRRGGSNVEGRVEREGGGLLSVRSGDGHLECTAQLPEPGAPVSARAPRTQHAPFGNWPRIVWPHSGTETPSPSRSAARITSSRPRIWTWWNRRKGIGSFVRREGIWRLSTPR